MCISMGYPKREAELELFRGKDRRRLLEELKPLLEPSRLPSLQQAVEQVKASDAVLDYLHRILDFTRTSELFQQGLSTRAGLGLLRAAQAWAFLHGEDKLLPGDLQTVLPAVAGHRLVPVASRMSAAKIGEAILSKVGVD
jgi:MoxR-like ATPase